MQPQQESVPVPSQLGSKALQHIKALEAMGERYPAVLSKPASPGRAQGLDYICTQLAGAGLQSKRDTWTDAKTDSEFTNITACLPGTGTDKVVIGCHHDTLNTHLPGGPGFKFVGANDSGSGIGLLIELGRALNQIPHEAHYELVFFDGEESLDWKPTPENYELRALFGSQRYVDNYEKSPKSPKIQAFVLLDMVGADGIKLDWNGGDNHGLREWFKSVDSAAHGGSSLFHICSRSVDDETPFQNVQVPIPTMTVSGFEQFQGDPPPHWHTALDLSDDLSVESLQRVGAMVFVALPGVCEHLRSN